MEEECFPAISMNTASGRDELPSSSSASSTSTIILKRRNNVVPEDVECTEIKGEPISAPSSPSESCQTSITDDKNTITMVFPQSLHFSKNHMSQTSDSEEDDEEYYQVFPYFLHLEFLQIEFCSWKRECVKCYVSPFTFCWMNFVKAKIEVYDY